MRVKPVAVDASERLDDFIGRGDRLTSIVNVHAEQVERAIDPAGV